MKWERMSEDGINHGRYPAYEIRTETDAPSEAPTPTQAPTLAPTADPCGPRISIPANVNFQELVTYCLQKKINI